MQKELNIKKIQAKFQELIQLDEHRKVEEDDRGNRSFINSILSAQSASSQPATKEVKQEKKGGGNE
jgi:hypothetical protein